MHVDLWSARGRVSVRHGTGWVGTRRGCTAWHGTVQCRTRVCRYTVGIVRRRHVVGMILYGIRMVQYGSGWDTMVRYRLVRELSMLVWYDVSTVYV